MAIMMKQPGFPIINILLVGCSGVGKASLKWRYIDGRFPEFIPKVYHLCEDLKLLNGTLYYLDVTEVIGDEDYDKLRPIIYSKLKENAVAIMCYSVVERFSLHRLRSKLIEEIRETFGADVPMILLGMKSDLYRKTTLENGENTSQVSGGFRRDSDGSLELEPPLEPPLEPNYLKSMRKFMKNQVDELSKEMNISKTLTCSALTGEGVTRLIEEAVRMSPLFRDQFRHELTKPCCCCCVL